MIPQIYTVIGFLFVHPGSYIYESAASDGRTGTGNFYVTSRGNENILALHWEDIGKMVREKLIKPKYPDKPEIKLYVLNIESRITTP